MIGAVVLRPEPGATITAATLIAAGVDVLCRPLFAVAPVTWRLPDPAAFDAVMLTSANAVRHGGTSLVRLGLPAVVVGTATGDAAAAAGLTVALTGESDAVALAAAARELGFTRLLHLSGRDHVAVPGVSTVIVYASEPLGLAPSVAGTWTGRVALLHSVRAALRFVALIERDAVARAGIAVAALSPAIAAAAGAGWACIATAPQPTDAALIAAVVTMIDPPVASGDNRPR